MMSLQTCRWSCLLLIELLAMASGNSQNVYWDDITYTVRQTGD